MGGYERTLVEAEGCLRSWPIFQGKQQREGPKLRVTGSQAAPGPNAGTEGQKEEGFAMTCSTKEKSGRKALPEAFGSRCNRNLPEGQGQEYSIK